MVNNNIKKDSIIAIVEDIHKGNNEAFNELVNFYKPIIRLYSIRFYVIGSDYEDLFQEGLIGLYKAVKAFDINKGTSFEAIAKICIKRNILQIVRSNNAKKHLIHNNSKFLFDYIGDNKNDYLINYLTLDMNPLDQIIQRESIEETRNYINKSFSDFEKRVFLMFIEGIGYKQISDELNSSTKSIDNALFRIKKKLKQQNV